MTWRASAYKKDYDKAWEIQKEASVLGSEAKRRYETLLEEVDLYLARERTDVLKENEAWIQNYISCKVLTGLNMICLNGCANLVIGKGQWFALVDLLKIH